ncbi:MAG: sulfite exporter TauE/SafE family protein [Thermoguttaceae bacterium]|jgi:uncharacterized membrane protein YfcA|nr:sulfite exporter TauE/SafE family protein [Thermoguttaceae bacterium]
MLWHEYVILLVVSLVAGAINAVAGGGTLLTFPSLLWAGHLSEIVANATSTVALWPGQLGSLWGYRSELGTSRRAMLTLAVPSLLGGALGATVLLRTGNDTFKMLVPYLILLATMLFMAQEPLNRWLRKRVAARPDADPSAASAQSAVADEHFSRRRWAAVLGFQVLVAIYGGYFGAGIGILMLAAFGYLGFKNIHRMNGLKNINGMCINAVAAGMFIANGLVCWPLALLMAAGAIVGGYAGAGTARKLGQKNVRRLIVLIGLGLTLALLLNRNT